MYRDRIVNTMKSVFLFGLLSTVYACSHPIEIVGEGDVLSATGTRTCLLEDFQAKKENCTRNIVHGEYTETYYAEPRDGWQFDQWLNYCTDAVNNECAFNIPSDAVQKNWGATLPPLVAVFKRIPLTIAEPASEPSPVPELPDTQSAPVAIYSYYLDRDGRLINPLPLENARLQRRTTHFGVTGEYQRISFRCCEVADDDAVHAPKVDVPAPTKILTVDLAALPNNHRQRLELHADLFYQDGTIASNSSYWFLESKETDPLVSRMKMSALIDSSKAPSIPVDSRYNAASNYYRRDRAQTQVLHLALGETSVADSPGSGSYTALVGMSGNDWVSGEVDGGSAILNPVASSTTVLAEGQTQLVLQGPDVVEDAVITAWRTQNSAWLDGRNQNHGGDTGASSGLGLDPRDAYELYGDARDAQQKMLLRFDLSDIPAGATIDSAVLGVYNSYSDGYDMPIYRVKKDWYEGEGNYWDLYPTSAAGVTYLYPDKSNTAITWGAEGLLAGTDYDSTAAGTIHFGGSAPAMRSSTELAALVQGWVDGDYANFGILVAMTPSGNSLYGIANWIPTSENAVVANRPRLTVTYSDSSPPDPSVPGVAIDPSPSDSGTGTSVTVDLEWTAGSDATSHDVYFGTSPPGVFQGNQTGTTFDPGPLEPNTTYYWRIDEVNDAGTTTGMVWSFTTGLPGGQTQLVLQGPDVVEDAVITAWRTQNSAWLDGRNQNHGGDTGASSGLGLDPRDAYELYGDARDAQQKMLLRFDLSDIPAGATIDSAVLGVYNSYSDGYDMPIYRVKKDWYEGEGNYWDLYPTSAAGVTYLYPDKSNTAITWGAEGLLAGTDYDSTAAGTIHFGGSAPAMRSSTELAALVQGWVDGDYANFGILVAMTPSGNSLYGIANWIPTSENAVVANRPRLTVTYSDSSLPDPSVPGVAIDPSPSDSGTGTSVTVDLEWTAGSDATSHDVYFGTSPPGVFQGNQTGTTFDPGPLEPNTTYYWRIDEVNDAGTTTGTVWSFTTGLEAGVDKSGWILGSEVWSGVINIVGDTTISGANTVVTVLPGTRIIYKGDYILKSADRSRLLMNASAESPIVVDAQATSGKLQIRGGQGEIRFCRLLNISVSATYPLLEPPLLVFEDNINLGSFYSGQQAAIIKRNYFGIYGDFVPGTVPSPFTGSAEGSELTDNVFNGGAWVAQSPQSTVRGNVFVSEYVPEGEIQNDYSHEHVLGMGTNCVFERNIFVGKSYGAMMAIGSNYGSYCLVRNNTIDMRGAGVGIYFHLTASPVVGMEVRNNLFLRATTGINDEQKQTNSIAYTDYNLFSEVDDRYFQVWMSDKEEGDDGYGLHDVEVDSPAEVIVNPAAGYPFPYSQAEIITGNVTPTDMLQLYRRAYALTSSSPAINAGSPADASDPEVTDGQCDIGALEYQVPETTMLNQ